ncbi:MAG: 50S ribosomal protein L5, partial [Nitrososphaerota archaeon]
YDPELGMIGMDVSVHITKPGYRVSLRRRRASRIGRRQRVTREEAIEFLRELASVNVVGGPE